MYRVYKQLIPVDDLIVEKITQLVQTKGSSIFNPDRKRWQIRLPPTNPFYFTFTSALESIGLVRGRTIGRMVALHSRAGCKQQQWHYDYDPTLVASVRKKPYGAVVALEHGTKLAIHGVGDVLLNPGDCLVFDGDCVHAGSAYDAPNTRVHVYLDVPTIDRKKNRTWYYN